MARANAAVPAGFVGIRPATGPGYQTTPAPRPYYLPNKGGYFANRLITHRTKCIFDARDRAEKHLADDPTNQFLIDFVDTLDHFLYTRGAMNVYQRYCHH